MKKFLPFLWLLPVVWFFVGMIFILLSGTGGTSGGFIAIILAAAYGVQLFVPVAYFCKRDSFKKYMLLLILISAIPTVAAIAVNGEEAGAACVLTLICAVVCMFTFYRQFAKKRAEFLFWELLRRF